MRCHARHRFAIPLAIVLSALADAAPLDVRAFGAKGDAAADDTAAFQAALDAAHAAGGGVVAVPAGRYRFDGVLRVPARVTLEGVWRAPVRGLPFGEDGSVLLVVAGKGEAEGAPFLRMGESACIKGLTVFYPEQVRANPPIPYPWTVQAAPGGADNLAIRDVTMVNPYRAVDFGTHPAGRHLVDNLHAYPLLEGIYVNQCYDVGRLQNVHCWPFWDTDPDSPLWAFTKAKGRAFVIAKTDGEMGLNLFSIFYSIGMHFVEGPTYNEDGSFRRMEAGSGTYTNCYMDVSPCAVRVDAAMPKAGIAFANSSFMSHIAVDAHNQGPVTFSACGFWATQELAEHAALAGRGTLTFDACHFNDWDRAGNGVPCIDANNQRLIVTGCDFPTERKEQLVLRLGPRLRSAVILGNAMPGGAAIDNQAHSSADIQIGFNTTEPRPNIIRQWGISGTRYSIRSQGTESSAESHERIEYRVPEIPDDPAWAPAGADSRGFVDLRARFGRGGDTAYAQCWIHSPRAQEAWFDFGFNDGGAVWLNGQSVYHRLDPAGGQCIPGSHLFRARIERGANHLVVACIDLGGAAWEFTAEVYAEDGGPLRTTPRP